MVTYRAEVVPYQYLYERPAASAYGVGQCNVAGVPFYSDGVEWNPISIDTTSVDKMVTTGNRDVDTVVTATVLVPFYVVGSITLNRVAGTVAVAQAAKLVEIGIYTETLQLLCSTERREVPEAGAFEFAHPPVTLSAGKYFYALSCNGTSASFGHAQQMNCFTTTLSLPLGTLAALTPAMSGPALRGYSVSDTAITVTEAPGTNTKVRVFCKNSANSQPWGLNTVTNKICVSMDSGATFTDMMTPPTITGAAWYDMLISGTTLFLLASNCKIYQSSSLASNATFTEITVPISAGLRRTYATTRTYALAVFQDYLFWGEYSATGSELANDPTDPAPPRIFKYGPLSGTPAWTLTKQMANARHIHSMFTENSSKLWVSVGDATYGADVGIWRCTNAVSDTWTKWTGLSSPNTDHYPVDFIEINPGVGSPTGLYGTSDRPGKHLLYSKVTGTAGSFNLSALTYRPNTISTETVRSMSYDSATGNIYYFTQETTDPALYVSPAPYTETYRLISFDPNLMLRSVISGGYLMCYDKRWALPKFPWQL